MEVGGVCPAWRRGKHGRRTLMDWEIREESEGAVMPGRKDCHSAGVREEKGRKRAAERGISELRVLKEIKSDIGGSSARTRHTSGQWQR